MGCGSMERLRPQGTIALAREGEGPAGQGARDPRLHVLHVLARCSPARGLQLAPVKTMADRGPGAQPCPWARCVGASTCSPYNGPCSPGFRDACHSARVAPEHWLPLWRLHQHWPKHGKERERLRALASDYGHFRLYERSRSGDEDAAVAFEARWRTAAARLLAHRRMVLRSEDLAALFFERVYSRVVDFDWHCSFRSYLHQLLVNLARDELRRGRAESDHVVYMGSVLESTIGCADPTPEDALRQIPPADRVLLLDSVETYQSPADMARGRCISRATLYVRLARARHRLRAAMRRLLDLDPFRRISKNRGSRTAAPGPRLTGLCPPTARALARSTASSSSASR
jgi:DNA-directed RNA polymerase specialized sigma24 family protein